MLSVVVATLLTAAPAPAELPQPLPCARVTRPDPGDRGQHDRNRQAPWRPRKPGSDPSELYN